MTDTQSDYDFAPTLAMILAPYGPKDFTEALLNTVSLGPLILADNDEAKRRRDELVEECVKRGVEAPWDASLKTDLQAAYNYEGVDTA